MIKFNNIQDTISAELAELNRVIVESLHTNNGLMQEVVKTYLATKGKQIRPILVILSAKTFGEVTPNVINAAAAIEMLHNASLIHDDVVDDSQKRRGLPTINNVWDNHVAVLVGDYFVSNALRCAIQTGNIRIISSMSQLGMELALGEIDQINNAWSHNVDESKYFEVIKFKTASLFRSCVEVGGFALNISDEKIQGLKDYAEILGLCFQIKDDIFDYYDDKVVGKPTGNDLREGKITLPLIYALNNCQDEEKKKEMNLLVQKDSLTTEEIDTLIQFAKEQGGIEYAYKKMAEMRDEAEKCISQYTQNEALDAFRYIFDFIISREK